MPDALERREPPVPALRQAGAGPPAAGVDPGPRLSSVAIIEFGSFERDRIPIISVDPTNPGPAGSKIPDRREPALASFRPAATDPLRREPAYQPPRDRPGLAGPIASVALHVLAALLIFGHWQMTPVPEAAPIPVTLVIEPPPKPPPAPPKPQPPPHGSIASQDMGAAKPAQLAPKNVQSPTPAAPKPAAPAAPPPPPLPQQAAADIPAPPPPKPKPPALPYRPARAEPRPARLATRLGRFPGPGATRDEYLAYLVALARQHMNLLPRALVGNRRGESVIGVVVLDNGRISNVHVARSSGYPDIDRRVEEMIVAVGRFPPLPQWFQGQAMQLEFRLQFPEALEE